MIRIERRIDTPEELILDIMVKQQSIGKFLEQGYMAVAERRNVHVCPDESLRAACERELSESIATELVKNAVMNMSYPFARSEAEDAVTVGSPLLESRDAPHDGKPFRFTARWAKLPQAELSSYEPIRIAPPAKRSSDDMVDQQIANVLANNARYEPIGQTRPVEKGDAVSLALHTTLGGEEITGLCFEERTYTTGVGAMPEDFERNVIGMTPGEEKSFRFQGIADFDEDEQPIVKTYEAHVKLGSLLERIEPPLTDAWVASSIPGCKTVEEFRHVIREQLDAQLDAEYRHYLNYIAASELAKRFEGSIPDVAYEAMRDELQGQFDQEAAQLGLSREEYMKREGADEQQFQIRMILQIRERLAQSIALDAYARHFDIQVNEEDLEEFFRVSAPAGAAAEMRRQLEDSGRMYLAYEGARRLKANDHLVAHAVLL